MIQEKFFALILVALMCVASSCDYPELTTGDIVTFTLLQTTDVHHRVIGTGPSATYGTEADQTKGGYARIATAIRKIRREKTAELTPVVLVDSGDFLMGTVYDLTLGDVPAALSFINTMKYDAVTLGNHEFDYGPGPLAGFIHAAVDGDNPGFKVPVVASNMVTSEADPSDDGLEALIQQGQIKDSLLFTLPNGLKVGLIGILGETADSDAPLTPPVTFRNDLTNDDDVAFIQARVDALREAGAHVVIAMSHSGIKNPNSEGPTGDDVALATKVTGIDIIASGHDHEKTDEVVMVGTTRIICAGHYGENLAQLDVTVEIGTGVTAAVLTNNDLNSTVALASNISMMVERLDNGINEALSAFFPFELNDIIAFNASTNVEKPAAATETGMGNLVSDSLRYLAGPMTPALGLVANGVVRNGFMTNQGVTFADMYSVLPLGMSLDPANQNLPGYPLLSVMMTKEGIANLCQLIAYIEAAGDPQFMGALATSGDAAKLGLYYALLNLPGEYYMNLSGVRFNHGGLYGGYQVDKDSIAVYTPGDFKCQNTPIDLADIPSPMLPCVLDLYMVLMLQDPGLQMLLGAQGLNIPISAYTPTENPEPVTLVNVLSCRLDQDQDPSNGIQEVKEWMALLTFLTAGEDQGGFAGNAITDDFYGADVIDGVGDASRVNVVPPSQ